MRAADVGGTVLRIWRYPVKSLGGEEVQKVDVEGRGLVGDRQLGLYNSAGKIASGKEMRRFCRVPGLLMASARCAGEDVVLTRGERSILASDPTVHDQVSEWFSLPLAVAREHEVSHFDELPISLLTTAALAQLADWMGISAVEPSRFRPNLLLDWPGAGCLEDGWIGRTLVFSGGLRLGVVHPITRCVMVTQESLTAPADPSILSTLADRHDACLGVLARVAQTGSVSVGEQIWLE